MDSEKENFLRSFKELDSQFQSLPIAESQIQRLKCGLAAIQKTAESLALYDPLTHALNGRAGEWLCPMNMLLGWEKSIFTIYGKPIKCLGFQSQIRNCIN